MIDTVAFDLPLAQPDTALRERADAARNRRRILEAASRLIDERGIEAVSMQDVAEAACVGTGTLYRRFGDRAGLAFALLDEHTRDFQNALLSGPPPLGPGAPAVERLRAFGDGYFEILGRHSDLLMAAAPGGRDGAGPHTLYATHLAILVREAAPNLDAEFTAEALLAAVAPAHFLHLRDRLGWTSERVRDGWYALVEALAS